MNLIASRAISIALFGGLVAFLSLGPAAGYGPQILAVFIAWASYYHFNGKLEGLKKSLITNLFGAAWGAVAVAFLSQHRAFWRWRPLSGLGGNRRRDYPCRARPGDQTVAI